MDLRKLGTTGLWIGPLVLGGNVFGWTVDEATSFGLLDSFVAAGFNMVDTADVYSAWAAGNNGGESETIIGNWLKRRGGRDRVIVATKVGWELSPSHRGLSRAHIVGAVESSLKRLRTDYIDLYQSHVDDPDTPVEEPLEAYARLIQQGKVRAIGASNFSAARLKQALDASERHGLPRYQTLQPLYNLCDRKSFESELEPLCLEEGIGVVTYYSLASGFLTGKYRSERDLAGQARSREVKNYLTPRGNRIIETLERVATRHDTGAAQIALAWLMARPSVTAPIASATSLHQLAQLMSAAKIDLDHDTIGELDDASA
jgi:aryl-alcohol dehydrogenase-like predicted oxidoreductase